MTAHERAVLAEVANLLNHLLTTYDARPPINVLGFLDGVREYLNHALNLDTQLAKGGDDPERPRRPH